MFSHLFTIPGQALWLLLLLNLATTFQRSLVGLEQKEEIGRQVLTLKGAATMSVAPYRFIVDFLSNRQLVCSFIVPLGSDPHHFEPTLSHLTNLGRADIALLTGEPCEGQFIASLKKDHKALLLDLRTTCSLLPAPSTCHHHRCNEGGKSSSHLDLMDTHLWLSPKRLIEQTWAIEKALQRQFPRFTELFAQNSEKLVKRLIQLDRLIEYRLRDLKIRTLLVSHPALTYFCKDYNLEQLSAETEGRYPSARQQTELLAQIKKQKIEKILVIQPHSEKAGRQIAKILNLEIDCINPYGENPIAFMENLCTLLTR